MRRNETPVTILVADDDPDDRMLIEDAFEEIEVSHPLQFVEDGEQLLQCLRRDGQFAELSNQALPGLILLDLNMPKVDGRRALAEIKEDERLCRIPVVIFTTSRAEHDVLQAYDLKASSFISKPVTFDGLVVVVKAIADFWLRTTALPPECAGNAA